MNKVVWDKQTGGVLLQSLVTKETLGVSPRPVFYEELDLLGLDKTGWVYPHCQEPIMWACNKQYYYYGQLLFEAKGANIYDAATVVPADGVEPMSLKPVNMKKMLERNREAMFLLESEAIEFIRDTYDTYTRASRALEANVIDYEALAARQQKKMKQKMAVVKEDCDSFDIVPAEEAALSGKKVLHTTKVDIFLASFSGGKDSQVVLDLCTRALPPSAFQVIYSDTGYELPSSLELYERVKEHYGKLYPDLKFSTARNHENVLNYWDKIGTPSDKHRWCCSVMKTAPLYRMLKVPGTNKQAKVLVFDGVRAEESTRRSTYSRIGKGVKHSTVTNASPILHWGTTEIFIYLFRSKLPLNDAYRKGLTRVGCVICPFSSEWNDMVVSHQYNKELLPFLTRIKEQVVKSGVKDDKVYIQQGNWKRRAGGRGLNSISSLEIIENKQDLSIRCINPQKKITDWLCVIGNYSLSDKKKTGELSYDNKIYPFSWEQHMNDFVYTFKGTSQNVILQGYLKRVLYKTTYCINCEACEVECPTGALSILPDVSINHNLCIHCHRCLDFHEHGCIVADSLIVYGNTKTTNMKLISYNNFGLNGGWFDFFITNTDTYFSDNSHGLNVKEQLPSFVKWLVQAGVLDDTKKKNVTSLGHLLEKIYIDYPEVVWQVIWINLTYNSPIMKWYTANIEWGSMFTEEDLRQKVKETFPEDSLTTIRNVVYAMARTFRESPIGEMGIMTKSELSNKNNPIYQKKAYLDVTEEALAYSLYKYAENSGSRLFRIKDLVEGNMESGIFKEFGLCGAELEKKLRSLNSATNRVIIAELNMGLDHITLRDDITSESVLQLLCRL